MPESKRIVISGGPATGKTSIIALLENRGFCCHHEVSREIIAEELVKGSDILPWDNLEAFSERVIEGRLKQFLAAQKGLNFYDRSIIDSVAYMRKDDLEIPQKWQELLATYTYHTSVFITAPWREIFENDHERRESWEQLLEIHEHLLMSYQEAGYKVLIVPQVPVLERVEFILEHA